MKATELTDADHSQPRAEARNLIASNPPPQRAPTTYDLVERKKALFDLIKGVCPETEFDYHNPEEAKRLRELNAELRRVNKLLAGVGG